MAIQKVVNVKYKISTGAEYGSREEAEKNEALIEPITRLRNVFSKSDSRLIHLDIINNSDLTVEVHRILTDVIRHHRKYGKLTVKPTESKIVAFGGKSKRGQVGAKKVNQYDEKGTLLATYESTILAGKAVNVTATCVAKAARGAARTAAGFFWSYDDEKPVIRSSNQPIQLQRSRLV